MPRNKDTLSRSTHPHTKHRAIFAPGSPTIHNLFHVVEIVSASHAKLLPRRVESFVASLRKSWTASFPKPFARDSASSKTAMGAPGELLRIDNSTRERGAGYRFRCLGVGWALCTS